MHYSSSTAVMMFLFSRSTTTATLIDFVLARTPFAAFRPQQLLSFQPEQHSRLPTLGTTPEDKTHKECSNWGRRLMDMKDHKRSCGVTGTPFVCAYKDRDKSQKVTDGRCDVPIHWRGFLTILRPSALIPSKSTTPWWVVDTFEQSVRSRYQIQPEEDHVAGLKALVFHITTRLGFLLRHHCEFYFLDMRVSKRVANLNKFQKEWAIQIPYADAKANALVTEYAAAPSRSSGTLSGEGLGPII
ncbi:hypothetical protein BGZ88_008219 [Linnemannia elongata]|nr:hypothetical protein BGZ88_008219 [Linnemannia elongata]